MSSSASATIAIVEEEPTTDDTKDQWPDGQTLFWGGVKGIFQPKWNGGIQRMVRETFVKCTKELWQKLITENDQPATRRAHIQIKRAKRSLAYEGYVGRVLEITPPRKKEKHSEGVLRLEVFRVTGKELELPKPTNNGFYAFKLGCYIFEPGDENGEGGEAYLVYATITTD